MSNQTIPGLQLFPIYIILYSHCHRFYIMVITLWAILWAISSQEKQNLQGGAIPALWKFRRTI